MRYRLFIFLGFLIVSLQACVYRMDIPQGNEISADKLAQLKTGMTRKQVIFLLGNAAINDTYHANQAHYVYYLYNGDDREVKALKKMVLTYSDDILTSIDGSLQ